MMVRETILKFSQVICWVLVQGNQKTDQAEN
jgi:hypothetical protein